jgi:hypothetical protein
MQIVYILNICLSIFVLRVSFSVQLKLKADIHHNFLLFSFQHHKVAIVKNVLLFSSHVTQILAEFQNKRLQAIQVYAHN